MGVYELKKVARLAFDNLVKLLATHGYLPVQESPGLWKHQTQPTVLTLCVEDFGIKANSTEDVNHLINAIKILQMLNRLGRSKLSWINFRLELHKKVR